jgi:NAD(P)-dependent dehydrogenase (short-subunit alcohol dehydrogenase family)
LFADNTLENRVAFITGGAGDIGFDIAQAYGRLGAKVVIASRNQERLKSALDQLQGQGIEAKAMTTDVRDPDQVKRAINDTVSEYGSLDILVNNAAGNFHCPTAGLTPNGWKTVIDIDLNGTFYGCLAAYEHLKRSPHGGNIISIITMLGVMGWPGAAHAAAAKAGILSLTRTLAVEWGDDNIRVNTISPGPIGDTEGVKRMYLDTGRGDLERRKTALGRFGSKSDISNAAVYLASDMASYVTGENIVVDGGRWLKYVAA